MGYAGQDVVQEQIEDDLGEDKPLGIWGVVVRGQEKAQDVVDDLAVVVDVDGAIVCERDVWLDTGKEGAQRGAAAVCVCGAELESGSTKVTIMLCEDDGEVYEDERGDVGEGGGGPGVEGADDGGEEGGEVGEEVPVVAGDAGVPRGDMGAEGEGDEVVELRGKVGDGGEEEGRGYGVE